jgi:hypothetical protein
VQISWLSLHVWVGYVRAMIFTQQQQNEAHNVIRKEYSSESGDLFYYYSIKPERIFLSKRQQESKHEQGGHRQGTSAGLESC